MTPKELSTLIHTLEADRLLTRAAIGFWLVGNEVKDVAACLAYCEQKGLLCKVERNGVEKWYRDGVEAPPPVAAAPPIVPVFTHQQAVRRKVPPPIVHHPQLFG